MTTTQELSRYQRELLDSVDNISESGDEKYTVECCYCGETFESRQLEKALNLEGVHRAEKHIREEGKLPKPEKGRDKTNNIVNQWAEKLEKQGSNTAPENSSLKTVLEIARINYQNQEKV